MGDASLGATDGVLSWELAEVARLLQALIRHHALLVCPQSLFGGPSEALPSLRRIRSIRHHGPFRHPAILLAVLVYAYCIGERSSRRIERRLHEHIAFRVLGRNLYPDHATLARFRAGFGEPLGALFATVLAMCARAGLIDLGLVAVDGTKLHANALMSADHSADGLRKLAESEAKRILDEAAAVDASEDSQPAVPTPRLLAERRRRRERIRGLLDELDAERAHSEAEVAADREQRERANAERRPAKRGRPRAAASRSNPDS